MIRIKTWEELVEHGSFINGTIYSEDGTCSFVDDMRELCGKKYESIDDAETIERWWEIEQWMVEDVTE